jgi:hypothetical protein
MLEHRRLVLLAEPVPQQVRRQVHIRTLLFGLDDPSGLPCARRAPGERHRHPLGEEVPIDDMDIGDCAEGAQIQQLPLGLVGVRRAAVDASREVLDAADVVAREE